MGKGAAQLRTRAGAEADRTTRTSEGSAFSRNVSQLLEKVEYRRCETGEDLEDIYRLRYDSYRAAGLITEQSERRIVDAYDGLPNAYSFGVYFEGHLVSTIRLHHITQEQPKGPSMNLFGDVLTPRLQAGESFVDPSRFAADHEWAASLRVVPYITLRLAHVACRYFEPTACLTTVREEHIAFYVRTLYAERVMGARNYPGLTVAGHLYQSIYPDAPDKVAARFPFFESTPMEQRMLFEPQPFGQPAQLTVLPTAKYRQAAA